MSASDLVAHQVKPGEVRNPEGRNQYTYRDDAETSLEKWCKQHGDAVIEKCVKEAEKGRPWAMRLLLDRILPVRKEIDHRFPDSAEPVEVPTTDERLEEVAKIVHEVLH